MTTIEELTVRNATELMQAIEHIDASLGDSPFYRGQTSAQWKLLPKAFRVFTPEQEHFAMNQFRREALLRHTRCPEHTDLPGWLCLMQHYGLPTRLLDWSLSPLVGAYFALTDASEPGDAVVWCLSPQKLNSVQVNQPLILQLANPAFLPLVGDAFDDFETRVSHRAGRLHDFAINVTDQITEFFSALERRLDKVILAVYGCEIDMRMLLQQGYFTIHGSRKPIEDHPDAHQYLIKCIIPSDAKLDFARQLRMLGIGEAMLFPDLNALARDVTHRVTNRRK